MMHQIVRPKPREYVLEKRRKRAEDGTNGVMANHFERLPSNVVEHILQQVPYVEWNVLSQTCRKWRQIIIQLQVALIDRYQHATEPCPLVVPSKLCKKKKPILNVKTEIPREENSIIIISSNDSSDSFDSNDDDSSEQNTSAVSEIFGNQKEDQENEDKDDNSLAEEAQRHDQGRSEILEGERYEAHLISKVNPALFSLSAQPMFGFEPKNEETRFYKLVLENGQVIKLRRIKGIHYSVCHLFANFQTLFRKVAIILVHGGYFAGAVFDSPNRCLKHKTFQKYIVRKGQGRRQSAHDKESRGQSIGAHIRRENEKKFSLQLRSTLMEWHSQGFFSDRLVFIGAPGPLNRADLLFPDSPLSHIPLFSVPFTTSRPTYAECTWTYEQLLSISFLKS